VKQEVDAAWKSGELDIRSLCPDAPVLNNTFHEMSPSNTGAIMGRKVSASTCIGNKILKASAVIIPALQRRSQIAKERVFAVVAVLVHRFDITMEKGKRPVFPGIDFSVLALGIPGPAKGMDTSADLGHLGTDA